MKQVRKCKFDIQTFYLCSNNHCVYHSNNERDMNLYAFLFRSGVGLGIMSRMAMNTIYVFLGFWSAVTIGMSHHV